MSRCSAPEVLTRQAVDEKVDMWALGVVMWVILTGRHPFGASVNLSEAEVARRLSEQEPDLRVRGVPIDIYHFFYARLRGGGSSCCVENVASNWWRGWFPTPRGVVVLDDFVRGADGLSYLCNTWYEYVACLVFLKST